jgi:hypothetical protein
VLDHKFLFPVFFMKGPALSNPPVKELIQFLFLYIYGSSKNKSLNLDPININRK